MPVFRSVLFVFALLRLPCEALVATHAVRSRRAANESSALSLAVEDPEGEGGFIHPRSPVMVHFMFLCMDHFPQPDIWAKFFHAAQPDSNMIWAHCVNHSLCESDPGMDRVGARLVPTVYNVRGIDLMTPFVHMLRVAMAWTQTLAKAGVMEKFVLLSDSTLPLKPYPWIFGELASTPESLFCIMTSEQWAVGTVDGVAMALVKHGQWVTLNRSDAEALVSKWQPVTVPGEWDVPLIGGRWAGQNRTVPRSTFHDGTWYTATDEEASYAYTHGPVELRWPNDNVAMDDLFMHRRCTTYVGYPNDLAFLKEASLLQEGVDPAKQMSLPITRALHDDPGSQLDVDEGIWHSYTITRLSEQSMRFLRGSVFMFARKFSEDADIPNFASIVLDA